MTRQHGVTRRQWGLDNPFEDAIDEVSDVQAILDANLPKSPASYLEMTTSDTPLNDNFRRIIFTTIVRQQGNDIFPQSVVFPSPGYDKWNLATGKSYITTLTILVDDPAPAGPDFEFWFRNYSGLNPISIISSGGRYALTATTFEHVANFDDRYVATGGSGAGGIPSTLTGASATVRIARL
jgi:hypothetical protein